MRFVLLMAHDDTFHGDPDLVSAIHAWIAEQTAVGVRVMGVPLTPPAEATTISGGSDQAVWVEGPFTSGPLHTAALEIIECADLQAARAIAQSHPMAARATIEVRPVWDALEQPPG